MKLKYKIFNHKSSKIDEALGIDKYTKDIAKEKIFFAHFANSIQAEELFGERDDAPKELTTVTGDLARTLSMISDDLEYEFTLLYFLQYHTMAQKAFGLYQFQNDEESSKEDKIKLEVVKLIAKLKAEEEGVNTDSVNIDGLLVRIDKVKKSNYNFSKYFQLMGFKPETFNDVDDLLNNVFTDNGGN